MARVDCRVSSVCFALALLVSCLGWGSGTALAQKPEQRPDVRVVVDVSGSMKRNDPDQLAASAMELLVSLLPGGVSAGVWTFGERVDNPLPLGEVSEQWRERALALPPALRDYQQYTDIETALEQAASAEANGWRHLILMTDGVIDLPPSRGNKPGIDEASRQRLVESMAPRFADRVWWCMPSPSPTRPTWPWSSNWRSVPVGWPAWPSRRRACWAPSWTSSSESFRPTSCRWKRTIASSSIRVWRTSRRWSSTAPTKGR
ncbi:von Willebrand factor type A domain protein [Halomonas elongata]|uniref:von Willebrand factor type A domain protein n=1 Tax=Halomonas elongata TaxID=2746 RepID=A0A1B8P4D5_HALEL|nr:vWA domain-containing protein [Halomonas elongata]OBX37089.1 von Willebrand factor type A domain protein [Halomonas elongata]